MFEQKYFLLNSDSVYLCFSSMSQLYVSSLCLSSMSQLYVSALCLRSHVYVTCGYLFFLRAADSDKYF